MFDGISTHLCTYVDGLMRSKKTYKETQYCIGRYRYRMLLTVTPVWGIIIIVRYNIECKQDIEDKRK